MTIDELITQLQVHRQHQGGSCPVMVAWEGVVRPIETEEIYVEDADALCLDLIEGCVLLIDADASSPLERPC